MTQIVRRYRNLCMHDVTLIAGRQAVLRMLPDLAGRLAQQGALSPESASEQRSAGLTSDRADRGGAAAAHRPEPQVSGRRCGREGRDRGSNGCAAGGGAKSWGCRMCELNEQLAWERNE